MNGNGDVVIHLQVKGDGQYYPVGGETLTALFEIRTESGDVIESNWDRKKPLIGKLGSGQVVKGLDMFARQLTTGDRAHTTLVPALAYGSKGLAGFIKGDTKIVVEMQILSINVDDTVKRFAPAGGVIGSIAGSSGNGTSTSGDGGTGKGLGSLRRPQQPKDASEIGPWPTPRGYGGMAPQRKMCGLCEWFFLEENLLGVSTVKATLQYKADLGLEDARRRLINLKPAQLYSSTRLCVICKQIMAKKPADNAKQRTPK